MRWCRGDIRRQIEFFDPSVTIAPRALINPPFRGGSCPKSVTHVSLLICYPCPPTIPTAPDDKGVALDHGLGSNFTNHGAVFHAPIFRITLPPAKCFAIEYRAKS